MKIRVLFIACVLTAASLLAQDTPPAPAATSDEVAIIPIKTLTGDSFTRLVRMLSVFNVRMTSDDKLRTIIVYAPKVMIEKIRVVVNELDRPGSEAAIGRNIDATLTLLRCSPKASNDAKPLPADMEGVAKQLRSSTVYKTIEVWDSFPLRLQEGKLSEQNSRLPGSQTTIQVRIMPEAVTKKDRGRSVRFNQLNVALRMLNGASFQDVGINTAGDFLDSQKTVIGKMSINDDEAVFVVVSLTVLD